MDIRYIKAKELSARWGVTPRRINQLCTEGKLPGAYKEGKFWMIPDDVDRPDCLRENRNLYVREDSVVYNRKRPCPVGITSYKEVSNECYYVDKTLLIRDIIDNHSKVYLFTRPRRFGKTLTMDMVRTFFEKTDTDTSVYFKNKKIWREGALYKEKQGQYPVIFLTFKDAHQSTWQDMYASLCFTLRNEFLRHIELTTSARLSDYDKKYLKSILDDEATIIDYQFALGKLSAMLSKHYGRNVIVIIDEYDTPIQQGHIFGAFDAFYYGQDFGYNHANAILGVGWKDGEVYICSEIYVFEKDTEEIIGLANQAKVDRRVEMFCDSAEPDRIKTWQKAGFRAYPVKKEPGSVKAQIDWLKGRKIHIHPSCVNVLKEVQQWKWKKDPTTGLYIDEPVEFMDDAMAALRYSVERLRRGSAIEVLK